LSLNAPISAHSAEFPQDAEECFAINQRDIFLAWLKFEM